MASRQRTPKGDSQKAAGGVKGANGGSSRILGWVLDTAVSNVGMPGLSKNDHIIIDRCLGHFRLGRRLD